MSAKMQNGPSWDQPVERFQMFLGGVHPAIALNQMHPAKSLKKHWVEQTEQEWSIQTDMEETVEQWKHLHA